MGIFNFLNGDIKSNEDAATKIYKEDPERAMNIALGEEFIGESISVLIYAKVCDNAERELKAQVENTPEFNNKMEICMKLGNAHKNRKISAIARQIKIRNKDQFIEIMKEIVDARIKSLEEKRGKTYEKIIEEEVNMLKEEMEKPNLSDKDIEETFIETISEFMEKKDDK